MVVLTGRPTRRSRPASTCAPRPRAGREMLVAGARLAERIMTFPRPVVAVCNGNALAMAGFLLLSADHRVGADGDFKIGLNEVADRADAALVRDRDRPPPADAARTSTAARSPGWCSGRTRRRPPASSTSSSPPADARGGRASRRRGPHGHQAGRPRRHEAAGSARPPSPASATGSTGSRRTTASGERRMLIEGGRAGGAGAAAGRPAPTSAWPPRPTRSRSSPPRSR